MESRTPDNDPPHIRLRIFLVQQPVEKFVKNESKLLIPAPLKVSPCHVDVCYDARRCCQTCSVSMFPMVHPSQSTERMPNLHDLHFDDTCRIPENKNLNFIKKKNLLETKSSTDNSPLVIHPHISHRPSHVDENR